MCSHCGCQPMPRRLRIEQDLLADNARRAAANRAMIAARKLLALNLMASPGAGKTALLVASLQRFTQWPVAVIEGDQHTELDAQRIRGAGAEAVQVNTGPGCHLNASMIAGALDTLEHTGPGMLFIENVGNLVCPASFDLGENAKVVILSVTEGADKPLKYPAMFQAAQLLVVNKIDLLPYVDFDVDQCLADAWRVNPQLEVLQLSAATGQGMAAWQDWLLARLTTVYSGATDVAD